jgi:hypothetical protein
MIRLGHHFDQPVILPKGLRRVELYGHYSYPLVLPEDLQTVVFGMHFPRKSVVLPKGLKEVLTDYGSCC